MRSIIWSQTLALVLAAQTFDAHQGQPPPQVFRGRIALVPVDVRVVDRAGDPVRDLTRDDFTILENGVRQTISHFEIVDRTGPAAPEAREPSREAAALGASAPRNFVIVLGRGRLQGPAKGFDAVRTFLNRLSVPPDRVAVAAYDRISELTTDREAVLRLIARYRQRYERIEALLDHWFRGLTVVYGAIEPPPSVQALIDDVFDAPGLPASRSLAVVPPTEVMSEDERDVLFGNLFGKRDDGSRRGFIYNAAARQDLEKLHAAVEYLRYIDGEKHVVLISWEGLVNIETFMTERLTRLAADARVTLSVIHTGGIATSWLRSGKTVIFQGPSWDQLWANADSRTMADETGGITSIYAYADKTLDRVDRATRFEYLLGYYPQDSKTDTGFRHITVEVRRPGVTVLYRHGYYARPDERASDRRESVAAARIASAGAYPAVLDDLPVELSASVVKPSKAGAWEVEARVRIAPASIAFSDAGGRHIASLDVALFVGASDTRTIGELRTRVDLKLSPDNYARTMRDGVIFTGRVTATARPRHVKAVVYDYRGDRLGSALVDIR